MFKMKYVAKLGTKSCEGINKDLSLLTPLQRLEEMQCAQNFYKIVFELFMHYIFHYTSRALPSF